MSEREDRVREDTRRSMGLPNPAFYASLTYCGVCPGGPLLYGDGTCPVCKKKNPVKFEDTTEKK